jgi:benzodiazapine receptor
MSIRAGAKASTAPSPSPSNFKTVTKYMLGFDVYAVADAGILLGITKMASALSAQDGNLFQSVLDVLTWILLVNFSDAMMKYVQKATSGLGLSPDRKPLDMEWYKTIAKPSWTPPNIAFPIVWGILKILQTTALVIAWRAGGRKLTLSIGLFLIHLCIGDVWNRIFFANHHMGTGMVVIVKMWLWLAATIYFMCSDSPAAGALLVPTLVWLTIASALNISIWSLNGKESIWPKVPALKEKKAT